MSFWYWVIGVVVILLLILIALPQILEAVKD